MEKKINLDSILKETYYKHKEIWGLNPIDSKYNNVAKEAMLEFGKQLLELAADNALVFETEEDEERRANCVDQDSGQILDDIYFIDPGFVDRDSILNTINQVE